MKPLSDKQIQKRNNIINAASELFAFGGFADTTIAKIAKQAGISFGSVFTYFETKEALFEAVILEPLQDFRNKMMDLPREQLEVNTITEMTKRHVDFFSNHRMYLQLIQQVLGQPDKFPTLFEELDQFYNDVVEELMLFIKAGQESNLLEKMEPAAVGRGYISFLIGMRLTIIDEPLHPVWEHFYLIANRILGLKNKGG